MTPLKRAAFFDLDRTVLRIDTGTSWMRFLYGRGEISTMAMARVLYWNLLYRTAVLDMRRWPSAWWPTSPAIARPS